MIDSILNIFRNRKLKKFASDIPTSILKLSEIKTANVVIDVEEAGFDLLKEDILTWGRNHGIKINIYFFDFRKLGANELLLTSIQTTVIKRQDMPRRWGWRSWTRTMTTRTGSSK